MRLSTHSMAEGKVKLCPCQIKVLASSWSTPSDNDLTELSPINFVNVVLTFCQDESFIIFPRSIHAYLFSSQISITISPSIPLSCRGVDVPPESKDPTIWLKNRDGELGRYRFGRWTEGRQEPSRYEDRPRVRISFDYTMHVLKALFHSNELSSMSTPPQYRLIGPKVAIMEKRITELDIVIVKLVSDEDSSKNFPG